MDLAFLTKLFEEHSGNVYRYLGTGTDHGEITARLRDLIGDELFISRVTDLDQGTLVYVDRDLPEDQEEFGLVASLVPPEYQPLAPAPESSTLEAPASADEE